MFLYIPTLALGSIRTMRESSVMADRIVEYLEEPKMEKATSTMLVVLVIGALIGAAGAYYYVQPQLTAKYDAGYAAGSAAAPAPTSTAAPDISVEWDISEIFDFSTHVNADGDVDADTELADTIFINNTGDTDIAALYVSLKDPKTAASGISDELENKYFYMSFDLGAVTGINIYEDGEYRAAYNLGALPAGSSMELDFAMGMLENTKGLFEDGETYDECMLYFYTSGSLAEELDFTVLT